MKSADQPYIASLSPLVTGLKGKCPRCGKGELFSGYLTVAKGCPHCSLSFDFADAGDGAPWFVMLISGAMAVAAVLILELNWMPPYWVHAIAALGFAVLLPLLLLRPMKGVLLCQQYRTSAEEGRISS